MKKFFFQIRFKEICHNKAMKDSTIKNNNINKTNKIV